MAVLPGSLAKGNVAGVLYWVKHVGHVWNFAKAWSTLKNRNKTSQTAMVRGFSTNTSVKPFFSQCNLRFLLLSPPEQHWCEDETHITIWTMVLGHLLRETFVCFFLGEWILRGKWCGNFLRDNKEKVPLVLLWLFNNAFLQCVSLSGRKGSYKNCTSVSCWCRHILQMAFQIVTGQGTAEALTVRENETGISHFCVTYSWTQNRVISVQRQH